MIKIYGMSSCPDCTHVWEQVKGKEGYEVIDIGLHVRDLKGSQPCLRLGEGSRGSRYPVLRA